MHGCHIGFPVSKATRAFDGQANTSIDIWYQGQGVDSEMIDRVAKISNGDLRAGSSKAVMMDYGGIIVFQTQVHTVASIRMPTKMNPTRMIPPASSKSRSKKPIIIVLALMLVGLVIYLVL